MHRLYIFIHLVALLHEEHTQMPLNLSSMSRPNTVDLSPTRVSVVSWLAINRHDSTEQGPASRNYVRIMMATRWNNNNFRPITQKLVSNVHQRLRITHLTKNN